MPSKNAIVWSVLSAGLKAGAGLIALPVALMVLSATEMGLYYLYLAFAGLALLLDMGLTPTLVRFTSHAFAGVSGIRALGLPEVAKENKPNWQLLSELLISALAWFSLIGFVVWVLLASVGAEFIRHEIVESNLPLNLLQSWYLMAFAVALGIVCEVWRTVLFGTGSVVHAHQITIASQIASIATTIGCLIYGLGLWSFPIARMVYSFINAGISIYVLRSKLPKLYFSRSISVPVMRAMWPMSWRQGCTAVGDFFATRGTIMICAALFTLEETARFGLTMQLLSAMTAVCSAPFAVSLPRFAEYRVQRQKTKLVSLFGTTLYLGVLVLMLFGGVLIFAGPPILFLLGSETQLLSTELLIIVLLICVLQFHQTSWNAIIITENTNPFAVRVIVVGGLVMVCAYFMGSAHGLIGMLATQLFLPLTLLHIWIVIRGFKGLKVSLKEFVTILGVRYS